MIEAAEIFGLCLVLVIIFHKIFFADLDRMLDEQQGPRATARYNNGIHNDRE